MKSILILILKSILVQIFAQITHLNYENDLNLKQQANSLFYIDKISGSIVKLDPRSVNISHSYIEDIDASPILVFNSGPKELSKNKIERELSPTWLSPYIKEERASHFEEINWPLNSYEDEEDGEDYINDSFWEDMKKEDDMGSSYDGLYLIDKRPKSLQKEASEEMNHVITEEYDSKFYYIDTPTLWIDVYDFLPETTGLTNRRRLFNPSHHGIEGVPNGMTIDNNGHLWVTFWGSSFVALVNTTDGSLIASYQVPPIELLQKQEPPFAEDIQTKSTAEGKEKLFFPDPEENRQSNISEVN